MRSGTFPRTSVPCIALPPPLCRHSASHLFGSADGRSCCGSVFDVTLLGVNISDGQQVAYSCGSVLHMDCSRTRGTLSRLASRLMQVLNPLASINLSLPSCHCLCFTAVSSLLPHCLSTASPLPFHRPCRCLSTASKTRVAHGSATCLSRTPARTSTAPRSV